MEIEVGIIRQSVALNSRGRWCSWDDLTPEERAAWERGQRAADEWHDRQRCGSVNTRELLHEEAELRTNPMRW